MAAASLHARQALDGFIQGLFFARWRTGPYMLRLQYSSSAT